MDNPNHSPSCICVACHASRRNAALAAAKEERKARRSAAACSPRELARKIAERLLVNGFGDIGTRLEIKRETNIQKETSLGGWCLEAAVDQIAKVIEENAERIHGGAGQSKQPETPTPLDGASCSLNQPEITNQLDQP
jgi:hypothetical protein